MAKYSFSGHESFVCKQFWLKKGYDFVCKSEVGFDGETAVVELGVGKNMTTSIRHWLKSFGIIDEKNQPTPIADFLFNNRSGRDRYLEDFASVWLLHYFLVKSERASIYNLVFNEFRKERYEFTKEQLHGFLKRKCEESGTNIYNENTINSDIAVFLRNYLRPDSRSAETKLEIEEDFASLLIDLDLIKHYKQKNLTEKKTVDWYKIESDSRTELPFQIVLFSILDNYQSDSKEFSVTFRELQTGYNSPGAVFCMNAEGLYQKIQEMTKQYHKRILFTETAGNQVLQFKGNLNKIEILDEYYQI